MRLRAVVDHLSAMISYWDATQRCRFANRAFELWFGIDPTSMLGQDLRAFLGPLYELHRVPTEGVLRGQPQEFQRIIPDPRGGPARHCLTQYMPDVVDGRVLGFFVLVTDVSSVKQAEAALPEPRAAAPRRADGATPAPDQPTPRPCVLIIDDDAAVAKVLRRLVSREVDVVVQTDATQAVSLLCEDVERFALVFCDLMMPELNGEDLYYRAQAASPALARRFVFMTGGAYTPEGREFLASVERPVLDKPFDVAKVRQLVRELRDER